MPISQAQLQELYGRYAHVIHRRCLHILGNDEDARDAVQETFARVIVHYDEFRQDASPLTWMYRISTNWCLNRIRNRSTHALKHEHNRQEIVGDGVSRPQGEGWEAEETIRRLLADADDETRAIVVHLFFDDLTREETARRVGISQPTLRKRLHAFLERARASMESGAAGAAALLGILLGLALPMGPASPGTPTFFALHTARSLP